MSRALQATKATLQPHRTSPNLTVDASHETKVCLKSYKGPRHSSLEKWRDIRVSLRFLQKVVFSFSAPHGEPWCSADPSRDSGSLRRRRQKVTKMDILPQKWPCFFQVSPRKNVSTLVTSAKDPKQSSTASRWEYRRIGMAFTATQRPLYLPQTSQVPSPQSSKRLCRCLDV